MVSKWNNLEEPLVVVISDCKRFRTFHHGDFDAIAFKDKTFEDDRGWFTEVYNEHRISDIIGKTFTVRQVNHSLSVNTGTVRGLHFQLNPLAMGKIVRCTSGSIYDVAVDIRKESETYGKWAAFYLSAENGVQYYIPKGFAHGFMSLRPNTEVQYLCDECFDGNLDRSVYWEDPDLNIEWPNDIIQSGMVHVSDKDLEAVYLRESDNNFTF